MSTDKPHLFRIDNQEIRPLDHKLVLGRHPACDYVITLNDKEIGISGRHAAIYVEGDAAWLEDLGSTNGTWVKGERIATRTRLAHGDRFQLDRLEFEFRAGTAKPVVASPTPKASTTLALGLEDLALPAPAPLPVKTAPPQPAVAPPPKPQPAPAPVVEVKAAVVEAKPAQPAVTPRTVEVKVPDLPPQPAPLKPEPMAAPPPPPPQPEPAKVEPPKAAAPESRPQKVAGSWISADHSGKTKVMLPEERARLREDMGSGLYAVAETVSVPTLLFVAPEERRVSLAQRDSATQEWSIGSNADADVSIPSDGLSGLHAKILRNGQTWTISDLMSANGTFVNGQKINRSHLESGSQLGFGPVLCTFLLPEGALAEVAPRPSPAQPSGRRMALSSPLLLGGAVLGLALLGTLIYLLLR